MLEDLRRTGRFTGYGELLCCLPPIPLMVAIGSNHNCQQ